MGTAWNAWKVLVVHSKFCCHNFNFRYLAREIPCSSVNWQVEALKRETSGHLRRALLTWICTSDPIRSG